MAATSTSACRVMSGRLRVRVWHTVTVALPPAARCISKAASGLPTMLLRPTMTTCRPAGS